MKRGWDGRGGRGVGFCFIPPTVFDVTSHAQELLRPAIMGDSHGEGVGSWGGGGLWLKFHIVFDVAFHAQPVATGMAR